jgi:multidrug efflux pump subunit AcrA (membrane-fusion protein)
MTGVVTERKRSPGEHVYEQTPILTIAEINPLNVEIVINAEQYKLFKVGMTAEVLPSAPVGGSYTARVDVFDPVIDPGSNTFRVRLVLPNPANAIPAGLRCFVRLRTAAR